MNANAELCGADAAVIDRPVVSGPGLVAVIGDREDILSAILDPGVQLALWQRGRPDTLDWIDTLDWDEIDDIDTDIVGPHWAAQLWQFLCDAAYPQTGAGHAFVQELAQRVAQFAALFRLDRLHMRLEVIETDACRKFHMDYVTARLLMPLSGPGTQWIEADHGSDAPIHQLGAGDVAIFKGRKLVDEPAILHRSPPVAGAGQTRLLFVLDPPVETSDWDQQP